MPASPGHRAPVGVSASVSTADAAGSSDDPEPAHVPPVPAGTWQVLGEGSVVGFTARHLLVTLVHGHFADVEGLIVVAPDVTSSSVAAQALAGSITTGDPVRDDHLRSHDVLDVATYPVLSLSGNGVTEYAAGRYRTTVSLTIRGITRPVTFEVGSEPVARPGDRLGPLRARFTARATVNRKDFGLRWNPVLEAGGVLVGEEVAVEVDVLAEHTGPATP
ncbi:MAG: YceI family protein [Actinomycetota bacterium]|nr:YceI family protein [Actinomycetota bacterium]